MMKFVAGVAMGYVFKDVIYEVVFLLEKKLESHRPTTP